MNPESILQSPLDFLRYMREAGYPVFHLSNIFKRDVQYAIRDYFRMNFKKDIGTRKSLELSDKMMKALEDEGLVKAFQGNAWTLYHEEFLLPPQEEEEKKETAEESA
ncbi:MAG: hypothetical protein CL946_11835 [Ectothiorhodospiraceae bacterium]|nr:hypothetical protein [Ectothiorhodospiraceae bacterium]